MPDRMAYVDVKVNEVSRTVRVRVPEDKSDAWALNYVTDFLERLEVEVPSLGPLNHREQASLLFAIAYLKPEADTAEDRSDFDCAVEVLTSILRRSGVKVRA